ncbi:MAG: Gfo/Idh/MocA family oxidoreductase [Chloroflexota bacterium]|nr:Gfo/Idh/MocA family oxidoreductase [Chloroflexota bacterium]
MTAELRVGVVGAGTMGETHVAAWAAEAAPVTVFSQDARRASALSATFGAAVVGSIEELLANVDIVDICTPTDHHLEMTIAAAAAGRHVICEKPLARTVADAERMVATCAAAGVRLFVAHVVRFFPEYALAHQAVVDGAIGEPAVLRLKRATARPRLPGDHWLFDPTRSGGMILDFMIHDFDYARWIAGDVESVHCRSVGAERPELGVEHAVAFLRHVSGAISQVSGSWAYSGPVFRTAFEIGGSHGLIEQDSEVGRPLVAYLHAGPTAEERPVGLPASPVDEDPYRLELREFYRAIVDGSPARVGPSDGVEAVRIALAAAESARTGRRVDVARGGPD